MEQSTTDNQSASVKQPISVGEWMVNILIAAIPGVNIIMFFVWGFGDSTDPVKANWAKATLLWMAISTVLSILFFSIFGFAVLGSLS